MMSRLCSNKLEHYALPAIQLDAKVVGKTILIRGVKKESLSW